MSYGDIMRIEATVSDIRGAALLEMCQQLGLSRSQVVDEAITLLVMLAQEARSGRRLVSQGRSKKDLPREIRTPILAQVEWLAQRQTIDASDEMIQKIVDLVNSSPAPAEALKKLMLAGADE